MVIGPVNGSSVLNESESDYVSPGIAYDIPPSCKPTDSIVPLVSFNDSQIVDIAFFTPFEKIIIALLFPIVFILGFIGNVAFLTVVILVKEMHTLTNFYLANLAVADLLYIVSSLTLVTIPYALSSGVRIAEIGRTDVQCGIIYGVILVTYFSSLNFVTLVTFERFLAICYPLRYRIINNKKRKVTLAVVAWIIGTAIAALITPAWGSVSRVCLIWPQGKRWEQLSNVQYKCLGVDDKFVDTSSTLQCLAFIVNLAVYILICRKIISRLSNRVVAKKQADKTRNAVARMLIANGTIFFVCLGPYQLVNLLSFIGSKTSYHVLDQNQYETFMWFSRSLLLLNSAINPYVYGIANPKYRKTFITAFTCQKGDRSEKAPVPSVSGRCAAEEMELKDCRV